MQGFSFLFSVLPTKEFQSWVKCFLTISRHQFPSLVISIIFVGDTFFPLSPNSKNTFQVVQDLNSRFPKLLQVCSDNNNFFLKKKIYNKNVQSAPFEIMTTRHNVPIDQIIHQSRNISQTTYKSSRERASTQLTLTFQQSDMGRNSYPLTTSPSHHTNHSTTKYGVTLFVSI